VEVIDMQHIVRSQAAPTYLQALVLLIIMAEIFATIAMLAINAPVTGISVGAEHIPMPAPMPAPAPFVP
jgi:hypothetical protein